MKIINWIKQHQIIAVIILIFSIWTSEKLWSWSQNFFSHPPVTSVETMVITPKQGMQKWEVVGTVKAAQNIIIQSEISGTVQNLEVAAGKTVNSGDVLININHDDILAELQRDQAILTQKQIYYERLQGLLKEHATSQESVNVALSEFQQARASVAAKQVKLDKYIIKAPFTGTIGIWQINKGQLVKPGDSLVTLTQLSTAYIDFMLSAKALGMIQVGDPIQFTTMRDTSRIWHGKIVAIDPQLDNTTRNMQLRAEIDNHDGILVPYLYGKVTVLKILRPQLFIPQESVIYDPKGTSVYLLRKNIVYEQLIKLGEHAEDNVVVLNGLKAGDEIVTAGMMKLFSGMQVVVNKRSHSIS